MDEIDTIEMPNISGQLSQAYKRGFDDAADSQAVKERHWKELLEAIRENINLLDLDVDGVTEQWQELSYRGDPEDAHGTTYAELYKLLGLSK